MATATEFVPNQHTTDNVTAHVLWMTVGLSCEGDSVAMTSATSLGDIIQGVIPGMPRVVIHNEVIALQADSAASPGAEASRLAGMLRPQALGPDHRIAGMHELSVASAVLNTAVKHAAQRPVSVVSLRVGRLRQVVPDSLRFYFEIVARDTICERAELRIAQIDVRLRCADCVCEWQPSILAFRCPDCGASDVAVIAGEELEVDYIEVQEQETACIGQE
jgi:hydrogenase nickel incorporation protein HypA/HybF